MCKKITNTTLFCSVKIAFTVVFFLFANLKIKAQNSDTVHIPEITILEKYIPDITGLKIQYIDSATMKQHADENLNSVLSSNSSVYIKTYGAGKAASSTFRGAGANHTQLLWNGININSTMLGQADLSKLPVFFIDNISIYHGGAALSNNSGAFGGSINIFNKPDWTKKINIDFMQSAGSFNSYGSYLKSCLGNSIIQSVTRFSFNFSENNFPYKLTDDSEDIINKHAQYHQKSLLQEIYIKPGSDNLFSVLLWIQNNTGNLPETLADEKQRNNFGRVLAEWSHQKNKLYIITRAAYIQNYMNYTNSNAGIDSRNNEKNAQSNINLKYLYNEKINFQSGLNYTYTRINTNNYSNICERNQVSLSAGINGLIFKQKLKYLLLLKQEVSDKKFIPLIPSIGFEYSVDKLKNILIKTNFSRNYHLPSMNDLYWNPGGNPELLPEEGYFAEAGTSFRWKTKNEKLKSVFDLAAFYSNISNNIIWIPGNNPNIWTAQNIKEVNIKGVEVRSEYSGEIISIKYNYTFNYTFTSAKNEKSSIANDNSSGKQLIYVPFHSLNSNFRISWSKFYANYSFTYTGIRYISTDNLWYMPPYMISDLSIGSVLLLRKYTITLQFTAANLMNVDYQIVASNPMMRRNFKIALKINFSS